MQRAGSYVCTYINTSYTSYVHGEEIFLYKKLTGWLVGCFLRCW
jgi:hypothetical protein